MDKGAHFYRCDFQVHSPRDRQWVGQHPVEARDRFEHAKQFIQLCRGKGIEAVGITDHHDICFAQYYQLAAQDEAGEFMPVDPSRQRPVVFPGVELTLSDDPCQAIVLLDANASVDMQNALLQVLGFIPPHPEGEELGPEVVPLSFGLQELDKRLRNNGMLRDKYIILPHVSCPGHRTLLREGFHEKYRFMPCVGGYIEQDWEEHRKKFIVEGRTLEWGKAIGIFQTSDSRRQDRDDLACRSTWVKMAECTAEALRQACLAKESRIHQNKPILPTRYIARLEVSDSVFMGAIDFELNPQFTAIIGGRGTGKSTILEYIRWAMQDQPLTAETATEDTDIFYADGIERRRELIQETLRKAGGVVKITWNVDGVNHVVKANAATNGLTLMVGKEGERDVRPEEIRELLSITGYSQKQLSCVSIRTLELKRFVEQPIREKLQIFENKIRAQSDTVRDAYSKVMRLQSLQRSITVLHTRHLSIQERVIASEKALPDLSADTKATLSEHPARLRERDAILRLIKNLHTVKATLSDAMNGLGDSPGDVRIDDAWPQSHLLNAIYGQVSKVVCDAQTGITSVTDQFQSAIKAIKNSINSWRIRAAEYQRRYRQAEQTSSEHKERINQLGELRKEEAGVEQQEAVVAQQIEALKGAEGDFITALRLWMDLHKRRADVLVLHYSSIEG